MQLHLMVVVFLVELQYLQDSMEDFLTQGVLHPLQILQEILLNY